jgi:hypothetical protein
MQKEMKSKLYSHFVKSGTLMGGNFTKEAEEGYLEVYFYSIKNLCRDYVTNKLYKSVI